MQYSLPFRKPSGLRVVGRDDILPPTFRRSPLTNRKAAFDLFLASALGLFIELVFIRWVASELRLFAFYKNFALIAAFLGLGLGFAAYRRDSSQPWFQRYFFPLLLLNVMLVLLLGRTPISDLVLANQANAQEFVWSGYVSDPTLSMLLDVAFYAILFTLFALITVLFIPLGYLTASKFEGFQPLRGYTVNVLGALAGILLYTLISFLRWPPVTWFLLSALAALYFLPHGLPLKSKTWYGLQAAGAILLTLLPVPGVERTLWSPYYRIDLSPTYSEETPNLLLGYELSVNKAWHQRIWDLSPDFVADHFTEDPTHFDARFAEYDAPYQVAPRLDRVLIVGAGSGNDVAGALRAGAKRVTAVEIDPLILDIGRQLHPEDPYADNPAVTLLVEDARSYFRTAQGKFDLIVFGLLDSHTLFSAASSVRLDNFVYTAESLTEVKGLLAEDGLLALSFGVPPENEWIGLRLYRVLTDVFGHPPQTYATLDENIIFFIGLEPFSELLVDDPRAPYRADYSYHADIEPTTDQWPYLYLRERALPNTYIIGLLGVVLLSALLTRRVLPDFRGFNAHFFFMGAAFFLLETKSITEMALLLGSTWIVNAAVIAAILTMIVVANMLVERVDLRDARPYYLLLGLALLFNFFVPIGNFLGLLLFWRIMLAGFAQAIPLFFAGLIFAITFRETASIEIALGSNLIGAVLGGIFEYSSLVLGIRSLYLLALGFYLLSAFALSRSTASK